VSNEKLKREGFQGDYQRQTAEWYHGLRLGDGLSTSSFGLIVSRQLCLFQAGKVNKWHETRQENNCARKISNCIDGEGVTIRAKKKVEQSNILSQEV